jgi:hypothetical protein
MAETASAADVLASLALFHVDGLLTDDEFAKQKTLLLAFSQTGAIMSDNLAAADIELSGPKKLANLVRTRFWACAAGALVAIVSGLVLRSATRHAASVKPNGLKAFT